MRSHGGCWQLTPMPPAEHGVVHFKVETLQCRVGINPQHLQSLHIKITCLPEHKDQWTLEELQIIEKFFDTRASAPPFKPNALCGFGRMLNVPYNVLKDFVQIMKLELVSNNQQFSLLFIVVCMCTCVCYSCLILRYLKLS